MDLKGKIILSRNYRGDVPMGAVDKFSRHLYDASFSFSFSNCSPPFFPYVTCGLPNTRRAEDDASTLTPVICEDGVSFIYVKHNNLYCTCFVVEVLCMTLVSECHPAVV